MATGEQPADNGQNSLFHISTFKNFRLKATFRVLDGNSGIFFRAELDKGKLLGGYQLDLRQPASDRNGVVEIEPLLGTISPTKELTKQFLPSLRKGESSECEVVANGESIVVTINGIKMLVTHDARYSKGVIGL